MEEIQDTQVETLATDTVTEEAAQVTEAVTETQAETLTETKTPPAAETAGGSCPISNSWWIILLVVAVAAAYVAIRRKNAAPTATGKTGGKTDGATNGAKPVEIYVGNLSYDMNEDQFRKEFERFGVVKSARIIGHRGSGKSKGYGFIEMPHRKEANVAIKALHGKDIMGRKLRVNEARNGSGNRS